VADYIAIVFSKKVNVDFYFMRFIKIILHKLSISATHS